MTAKSVKRLAERKSAAGLLIWKASIVPVSSGSKKAYTVNRSVTAPRKYPAKLRDPTIPAKKANNHTTTPMPAHHKSDLARTTSGVEKISTAVQYACTGRYAASSNVIQIPAGASSVSAGLVERALCASLYKKRRRSMPA